MPSNPTPSTPAPLRASQQAPRAGRSPPRRPWRNLAFGLVLLLALAVRIDRAVREPVVATDVVRFIDQAKTFWTNPLAAVRQEPYHPLHALAMAVVHRLFWQYVQPDDRWAWIASAKTVGVAAGLTVIWLLYRLCRHFGAPWWAACGAALLWAVGRRTSTYGPDGLSDMLCLALFAAAILVGLRTRFHGHLGRWLAAGILSGLAYLTRPEGAAAAFLLAAALLLHYARFHPRLPFAAAPSLRPARPRSLPWSAAFRALAALAVGFVFIAAPYMLAIGKFTAKKDLVLNPAPPQVPGASCPCSTADGQGQDAPATFPPALAGPAQTLTLAQVPPPAVLSLNPDWPLAALRRLAKEIWETFGFAPCLITALAICIRPRLWGRPHWRTLVLLWIALWLALDFWLPARHGYLDGRHTLALQLVLHALFALALPIWATPMRWWQDLWRRTRYWPRLPAWMRWPHWPAVMPAGALLLACLPGTIRLADAPGRDRLFIRSAADLLEHRAPPNAVIADESRLLAFYSGRHHEFWNGSPETLQRLSGQYGNRLILVRVYQTADGQTPLRAFGPYQALSEFSSVGARHGDLLVLYAQPQTLAPLTP